MKTLIAVILFTFTVYLHCTKLKDYDEEKPFIDDSYSHTWLVQDTVQTETKFMAPSSTANDSIQVRTLGGDYE